MDTMSELIRKYMVLVYFEDDSTFCVRTNGDNEESIRKELLEGMGPEAVSVISMQITELIEPNDTFL